MNKLIWIWCVLIVNFTMQTGTSQEAIQPTIMILPSDGLVDRLGHLKRIQVDGRKRTVQDYEQLFIDEPELKLAISLIQQRFAEIGFPLKDLEYALKNINSEEAFDAVENTEIDLKGILLKSAKPDIYLELDYFVSGSGIQESLAFNVRAIDAYTNRSIASASHEGIQGINNNLAHLLADQVERNTQNLQALMRKHFEDIRQNGRAISMKVAMEQKSPIRDFRRNRCNGLPYARLIREYVKRNTKNSSFTPGSMSAKEIRYELIRIPLFDEEGYPIGASDWAYKCAEYINEHCDVFAIDNSSKLGEAFILITSE